MRGKCTLPLFCFDLTTKTVSQSVCLANPACLKRKREREKRRGSPVGQTASIRRSPSFLPSFLPSSPSTLSAGGFLALPPHCVQPAICNSSHTNQPTRQTDKPSCSPSIPPISTDRFCHCTHQTNAKQTRQRTKESNTHEEGTKERKKETREGKERKRDMQKGRKEGTIYCTSVASKETLEKEKGGFVPCALNDAQHITQIEERKKLRNEGASPFFPSPPTI
mmetsp:Transcript_14600/g.29403  ORF Transcript_14600/g.29403 Transcript_14600/m.29403 type:complete len:222 (-) Transcript_14600:2437-3102(-)